MTSGRRRAIFSGVNNVKPQRKRPGPKPRPALKTADIQGLKYFKLIQRLLASLHEHKDCPNRRLHYDQLASLILLQFFNPTLTSLRAVQQASGLRNVQRKLGVGRASLGSLSESSRVFDPGLLRGVVEELAARAEARDAHARPKSLAKEIDVVAVDGSLLKALPRMAWALWINDEQRAAKMHVEFDLLRGIPKSATVTHGNASERQVLRQSLSAGKLYVIDAGYREYQLFEDIRQADSSFVARLQDNAVFEPLEERPLTDLDQSAGVISDQTVILGGKAKRDALTVPVRVVKVHVKSPPWFDSAHHPESAAAEQRFLARRRSKVSRCKLFRHRPTEYDVLLVTDRMDLPAEVIALLYRYRWTIELFFRWFKCVLRFEHLLFESKQGVEILVYCALIASLLVTLWTGCKPTKRTLEMIQLYFQGWAELDELETYFAGLEKRAT